MKDNCVVCGVETSYDESIHIDMRLGYVEGIGQMCRACYSAGTDRSSIVVPNFIIYKTSNDAELGARVRELYYEQQEAIKNSTVNL